MSEQQEAYLETLIDLARRDAERAQRESNDPARRSIALWMVSEVERQVREMSLPVDVARGIREEAKALREKVREVRKPSEGLEAAAA